MVAVKKSALVFLITELYYWQIQVSAVCSNNPTYLYNDYQNEGKSCKWVENKEDRRERLCKLEEVHENCPITCGICCEDDQFFHFEDIGGEDVHCKWITDNSERKDKWCSESFNGKMIRDSCPYSCDQCSLPHISVLPTSLAPSPEPTPLVTSSKSTNVPAHDHCLNNKLYRYKGKSCNWIRNEKDRSTYCQNNEVKENCPITCGECCKDDHHYTFYADTLAVTCDWLSTATTGEYCNKWMNGKMIRNGCPESCDICVTSDHCHDDSSYMDENGESCESINSNEELRSTLCQLDEVNKSCPTSCGECCEDDDHFTFNVDDKTHDCDWISTAMLARHWDHNICTTSKGMNDMLVGDACPRSCNKCRTPIHDHCHNIDSFRFKGELSCNSIGHIETRRSSYCRYDDVKDNCPVTCGECTEDNGTRYLRSRAVHVRDIVHDM